jgi:plastocyanin
MDVRLEDGTWGKTEKLVKVGDTVTFEIADDNGNNIEVSGVIAEVGK